VGGGRFDFLLAEKAAHLNSYSRIALLELEGRPIE
jgi:hypothetical protein